jgi:hypothetical protein
VPTRQVSTLQTAACPPTRRTISASCAASYPRIRKTMSPAILCAEPAAPVRARDVAGVGDGLAPILRRSGHAPAGHDEFTFAIYSVADNRRELIREDVGKERQIAGLVSGLADVRYGSASGTARSSRLGGAPVLRPLAGVSRAAISASDRRRSRMPSRAALTGHRPREKGSRLPVAFINERTVATSATPRGFGAGVTGNGALRESTPRAPRISLSFRRATT